MRPRPKGQFSVSVMRGTWVRFLNEPLTLTQEQNIDQIQDRGSVRSTVFSCIRAKGGEEGSMSIGPASWTQFGFVG